MKRARVAFWPVWAAYVVFVGAVSLMPGRDVPEIFTISDKLAHFAAYMFMAAFTPWRAGGLRRASLTFAVLFLYGAFLELAQGAYSADRTPDILDALSNGAGVAAGVAVRGGWDRIRPGGPGKSG